MTSNFGSFRSTQARSLWQVVVAEQGVGPQAQKLGERRIAAQLGRFTKVSYSRLEKGLVGDVVWARPVDRRRAAEQW